jgi:hypothetical protein
VPSSDLEIRSPNGARSVAEYLLVKVNAFHCCHLLIVPTLTEFTSSADYYGARFGGDKPASVAFGQPFAILSCDGDNIGRSLSIRSSRSHSDVANRESRC